MKNMNGLIRPLFLMVLLITLLIVLKGFLMPLAYGLLIALIVYPVCRKLESKKVPGSISIFLSLSLVALVVGFIAFILILEIKAVNKELPELLLRVNQFLAGTKDWIRANLGLSEAEQNKLVIDLKKSVSDNIGPIITGSFSIAAETIFYFIIIPLYSALILNYRKVLVDFISSLLGEKYKANLPAILSDAIHLYYRYVKGMLWVYIIVGVLNSIGLLILGVDYAILFGMVTAFMTIIPYIGIIVSAILPMAFVWTETNNFLYPLGVVIVFTVVQYLEANLIFPYVVGKHLRINTLLSIIAILLGGALWGVSGMILFLPFIALLKIIADHIEGLTPLARLLEIPAGKT